MEPIGIEESIHRDQWNSLLNVLFPDTQYISRIDKVERLRTMPWEDILQAAETVKDPATLLYLTDDRTFRNSFWKTSDKNHRNLDVIIGNTCHDVHA
jgi:hypothetical protein